MTALAEPRDAELPTSPRAKASLVAEILATHRRARRVLRTKQLAAAVDELTAGHPRRGADKRDRVTAMRLERAVRYTLKLPGADSRCLMQSLVLTRLLARRGIQTRLVIAVRPGERFAAHAWIEHDDVALLPAFAQSFEQLVTL